MARSITATSDEPNIQPVKGRMSAQLQIASASQATASVTIDPISHGKQYEILTRYSARCQFSTITISQPP